MALVIPPFGQSPMGFFVPFDAQSPPPDPILADLIDPKTHDITSVIKSADVVDAQVQIAISVVRASGAAVSETGQEFRKIRKLTTDAENLIKSEARNALASLVRSKDIKIQQTTVDIFEGSQQAELAVKYINLRANSLDTNEVRRRITV